MVVDIEKFELLEACALTGQMSAAQLQAEMTDNPRFAEWFNERAKQRQGDEASGTVARLRGATSNVGR